MLFYLFYYCQIVLFLGNISILSLVLILIPYSVSATRLQMGADGVVADGLCHHCAVLEPGGHKTADGGRRTAALAPAEPFDARRRL